MCNAWNHPANCKCRFGGDTGGGGGFGSFQFDGWRYDSYVNPNARCPVCGAPVFFYQSPYGGRVFFDYLGPPWPKHPCTDNSYPKTYPERIAFLPVRINTPQWQGDGWEPFLCYDISLVEQSVKMVGDLTRTSEEIILYVSKEDFKRLITSLGERTNETLNEHHLDLYGEVLRSNPLLIRNEIGGGGSYELSVPFLDQYIISYDHLT